MGPPRVKFLVEEGADMEAVDQEGNTARLHALENRYMEVVSLFLDIDLANDRCKIGSVLLSAVEDDDPELVSLLINKDIDPNSSCKTGIGRGDCTVLTWAAKKGYTELVQHLIHYGADVNLQDNERWTPLARAAQYGHDAVVKLLIEHNAYIDFPNDNFTPLQIAAANANQSTVKLLVQHGACVAHLDLTPDSLLKRSSLGYYEMKHLSSRGSTIEMRDSEGRTPLIYAAEKGDVARVRFLVMHGAVVNAKAASGRTALLQAAARGHYAVVKILLKFGADQTVRDDDGADAVALAGGAQSKSMGSVFSEGFICNVVYPSAFF
ncbi:hypothetical protein AnigIFM59636_003016 [Aspergillus niger]|nr:hypothetical protein AnigIFM59636_003016 [Aspergillus niger]